MMRSTAASGETTGAGSQTLMRGLDIIETVARRSLTLTELTAQLGLARSTVHRLASALVDRGFLGFAPGQGYRLGPKLLELGHLAQIQIDVVQIARAHIAALAEACEDTVHFGVFDDDRALYLDKIAGRRRITIASRVGERQPLTSTALGKALILDRSPLYWRDRFVAEQPLGDADGWMSRMASYVEAGRAYDLEENEDRVRCVAAPVRDASGAIVGAISVSSAAQYMGDERMELLGDAVLRTAAAIGQELGWDRKG